MLHPLLTASWPKLRWSLAALGLLLLSNFAFTSGFFHLELKNGHLYGSLVDVLHNGAPVMLLAMGMTLVIATGGVDLSVGSVMAITGAVAALLVRADYPLTVILAGSLGAAAVAGFCNGLLVSLVQVPPIVATLILMVSGRGIAQLLTGGQILTIENQAPAFAFIGRGHFLGLPLSITLVIVVLALLWLLTQKSAAGLFIESTGDNEIASGYAGVNTRAVKLLAYTVCALCAGLAGLIAVANIQAADANNVGLYLELDAILAVVLGGTALGGGRFSLAGSLVGAVLIQTLTTTILARGIPPTFTLVVKASVIIAVCLLQSPRAAKFLRGVVRRCFPSSTSGPRRTLPAGAGILARARATAASSRRAAATCPPPRPPSPQPAEPAPSAPGSWSNGMSLANFRLSRRHLPLLATTTVCLLLYLAGCLLYSRFSSSRVLINFFTDNAFLGVAAIGMTFVILAGGIDLSVGAVIGWVSILTAALIDQQHLHPAVVIPLMLLLGLSFGTGMGSLIHFFELPPFLVTLAGMFFCRGLGLVLSQESLSITHPLWQEAAEWAFPLGEAVSIKLVAIIFVGVLLVAIGFSRLTCFGRNLYAIGGSEASARLMGLPVGATKVGAYALSGLCSALAGLLYTLYTSSGNATAATGLELDAIAAVVVGGTRLSGGVGHVAGTLVGVLIFGIIQTLITFQGTLSSWWTRILIGALLLTFILLQKLIQGRRQNGVSGDKN